MRRRRREQSEWESGVEWGAGGWAHSVLANHSKAFSSRLTHTNLTYEWKHWTDPKVGGARGRI